MRCTKLDVPDPAGFFLCSSGAEEHQAVQQPLQYEGNNESSSFFRAFINARTEAFCLLHFRLIAGVYPARLAFSPVVHICLHPSLSLRSSEQSKAWGSFRNFQLYSWVVHTKNQNDKNDDKTKMTIKIICTVYPCKLDHIGLGFKRHVLRLDYVLPACWKKLVSP